MLLLAPLITMTQFVLFVSVRLDMLWWFSTFQSQTANIKY